MASLQFGHAQPKRTGWRLLVCSILSVWFGTAFATLGYSTLPITGTDMTVTVFYPSVSTETLQSHGAFSFSAASDGEPDVGNRRLILVSHGSGGSPLPWTDLARELVSAGFVVAFADHAGDRWRDSGQAGPWSWKQRPGQASAAIDRVLAEPRFAVLVSANQVGVFGMSAGGLTALTMAGAKWSPARYAAHCSAHTAEDFPACVGLYSRLTGSGFDGVRLSVARWLHRLLFSDSSDYQHDDPRVRAAVAAVPMAAPIDPKSIQSLTTPVGLIAARKDAWLAPRFHVQAIQRACHRCELIADLVDGGHASLLSPWVTPTNASERAVLTDPPQFNRNELAAVYRAISEFFVRHLVKADLTQPQVKSDSR